jgi:hypothetical protein
MNAVAYLYAPASDGAPVVNVAVRTMKRIILSKNSMVLERGRFLCDEARAPAPATLLRHHPGGFAAQPRAGALSVIASEIRTRFFTCDPDRATEVVGGVGRWCWCLYLDL